MALSKVKISGLDSITATADELNYVDGVTSAIQTQMDAKSPIASPSFTGNVGIGTSSPSSPLTINRSTDGDCIEFETGGTIVGKISTDAGRSLVFDADPVPGGATATTMRFNVDGSEVMRIDSSGNLLVGTTDSDPNNNSANSSADNGFAVTGNVLRVAKYNDNVAVFNRTGSDGGILGFRKSGTTVGSIGSANSGVNLFIAGTTAGLKITNDNTISPASTTGSNSDADTDLGASTNRFKDLYLSGASKHGTGGRTKVEAAKIYDDGTNGNSVGIFFGGGQYIGPATGNTGVATDNAVNIGNSSYRFKDLYLSGGVYVGGTGSANKLDDYEEGTFTPTFVGTASDPTVTYIVQAGVYTKVGRFVHCTIHVYTSARSGGSGNLQISNLPFTCRSSAITWFSGSVSYTNNFTIAPTRCMIQQSTNKVNLYTCDSSSDPRADHSSGFGVNTWPNSGDLYFSISYETDA